MGNDQSSSTAGSASPKLSSYLNQKAKEGAARQRAENASSGGIVTVNPGLGNDGDCDDPEKDPELLRLKDIPRFYPIFRNALNIPGVKDPPDIYSKFDHLPITGICQRLTDHLAAACQLTSIQQNRLLGRCRDLDVLVASLTNILADRQKKYARFAHELGKVRELNAVLKKIDGQLPELVASIQSLNDFLPEDLRLEPLDLSRYCDTASATSSLQSSSDHMDSSSTLSGVTTACDEESSGSASLVSGSGEASPYPARHLPSTCSNSARSTPSAVRSAMHVRASAAGVIGRHRSSESGCANEADVGTGGELVLPDNFPSSLEQRVLDLSLQSEGYDFCCSGEDTPVRDSPWNPQLKARVQADEDYRDDELLDCRPPLPAQAQSLPQKGPKKFVNKNLSGVVNNSRDQKVPVNTVGSKMKVKSKINPKGSKTEGNR